MKNLTFFFVISFSDINSNCQLIPRFCMPAFTDYSYCWHSQTNHILLGSLSSFIFKYSSSLKYAFEIQVIEELHKIWMGQECGHDYIPGPKGGEKTSLSCLIYHFYHGILSHDSADKIPVEVCT